MADVSASFGALLRRARLASGLTQEELAEHAGLSARGVSDLERGLRRHPRPETIDRLAVVFALSPPARATWAAAARGVTAPEVPWPRPMTSFVGRVAEVADIATLFGDRHTQLITLTGPGGVGKTRLALKLATEVAVSYPDGVWFVDLAPVRGHSLVAATIAQTLAVRESGTRTIEARIQEFLTGRRALLVLDNFEHVLDAAPRLADWLAASPSLTVLVTSRIVLRLSGERVVDVAPLSLPNNGTDADIDTLLTAEAVQLFVERAVAARRDAVDNPTDLPIIAAICEKLDGLPLAIELAAARVRSLSIASLRTLLEGRLALLTEGPRDQPARLRSMRDAIAWSYELLPPAEQCLFNRLGVFVGGFDLAGVTAVADDNGTALEQVTALVAASLVLPEVSGEAEGVASARYAMLETIREYALERLAVSGEETEARQRHADHFDSMIEAVTPTPRWPATTERVHLIDTERDNIRSALAWMLQAGDVERNLRMLTRLFPLWIPLGNIAEGRHLLEQGLAQGSAVPSDLRGLAMGHAGTLTSIQGDNEHGLQLLEQALMLARAVANPTLDNRMDGAMMLRQTGQVLARLGRYEEAESYIAQSLREFSELGNDVNVAMSHEALGSAAYGQGDLMRARSHCEAGIGLLRASGNVLVGSSMLQLFGLIACESGDIAAAVSALTEAFVLGPEAGEASTPPGRMATVAVLAVGCDLPEAAARLFSAALAQALALGEPFQLPQGPTFERAIGAGRAMLGEDEFAAAWAQGEAMTPEIAGNEAQAILAALASTNMSTKPSVQATAHGLTRRELEVLRMVADGLTNREIADSLFISVPTVKRHLSTIFGKLGVTSRVDARSHARSHGLA